MKHLKHASETPTKNTKTLEKAVAKHIQHLDKHLQHMCETYATSKKKHTCNVRWKKTDETFGTDVCNIRVQLLQHVQHTDLLLQHPYKPLATYL
jgi:hypothetical protein